MEKPKEEDKYCSKCLSKGKEKIKAEFEAYRVKGFCYTDADCLLLCGTCKSQLENDIRYWIEVIPKDKQER
jgi:hypothetical protein